MSPSQAKKPKSYRIQLAAPMILLLLFLSLISLIASFYLGLVAGKSMQRPEDAEVVAEEKSRTGRSASVGGAMSEQDLKFFELSERKKGPEALDLEGLQSLKKKTEELTKSPTPPVAAEAASPVSPIVPQPPPSQVVAPKKTPAAATTQKPLVQKAAPKPKESKVVLVSPKKNPEYTVQVFASRKHANAEKLVQRLKQNGFPEAHVYKHTPSGGKTLYRVRVGKMRQSETQNLAKRLRKLKFIDSVQVTRF